MVPLRFLPAVFLLWVGCAAIAEDAPYPRISEEAFLARLPFFDQEKAVPLEARVVRAWDEDAALRQKFVFRGAQGFLVPGYIEFPKQVQPPFPLVLLLHGWSGSKQNWYEDGMISGDPMRRALLDAGYAILALDAATHGERASEIDYQHVNPHEDPNAPPRRNYFTFAEITVQTIKDYRRALDYLEERGDVDMTRIGLVGYSMGGMHSFFLLSVEPRLKAAVACVPPLTGGYGPAAPIDYTWGVRDKPLLLLMGNSDEMYGQAQMQATYDAYIAGEHTRMVWYDAGHKLGPVYVPDALDWLKRHL